MVTTVAEGEVEYDLFVKVNVDDNDMDTSVRLSLVTPAANFKSVSLRCRFFATEGIQICIDVVTNVPNAKRRVT